MTAQELLDALEARFAAIDARLEGAGAGDREALRADIVGFFRETEAAIEGLTGLKERIRGLVERYKALPAPEAAPRAQTVVADHIGSSTYVERGWSAIASGDAKRAVKELERALELAPDDPNTETLLGWAQMLREQYDDALMTYYKVLMKDPNNPLARVNLGYICLKKGIFGEAIEHLCKAIRQEGDRKAQMYAHLYMGLVYLEREMYEDARGFFRANAGARAQHAGGLVGDGTRVLPGRPHGRGEGGVAHGVPGQPLQPVGRALRQGAGAAGGRGAGLRRRLTRALLAPLLALLSFRSAGIRRRADGGDGHPHRRLRARDPRAAPGGRWPARCWPPPPGPCRSPALAAAPCRNPPSSSWRPRRRTSRRHGRARAGVGGRAWPSRTTRIIVLPVYPIPNVRPVDAAATLRHEVAHLALHERLPGPIPRWFNEGYAEVAAGSWDVESGWTLRLAFLLGSAPPLDSLELAWPRSAARARLAYLLSATMVDHLRRRSGERGFALLMENWRREGSLDRSVRVTFGMTMGQLEDEWRKDVRKRYGWLSIAGNVGLIWVDRAGAGLRGHHPAPHAQPQAGRGHGAREPDAPAAPRGRRGRGVPPRLSPADER